jgi:hypothetical protein
MELKWLSGVGPQQGIEYAIRNRREEGNVRILQTQRLVYLVAAALEGVGSLVNGYLQ